MTEANYERCRSCGAPIIWASTERGKAMPVDAQTTLDGNLVLDAGIARVVGHGAGQYVSHFATCANAAQHRRRR